MSGLTFEHDHNMKMNELATRAHLIGDAEPKVIPSLTKLPISAHLPILARQCLIDASRTRHTTSNPQARQDAIDEAVECVRRGWPEYFAGSEPQGFHKGQPDSCARETTSRFAKVW